MHPRNNTKYKSLNKIASHPSVEEIWDEDTDGLWIQLNEGWIVYGGDKCVHEWSLKDLINAFKMVQKC